MAPPLPERFYREPDPQFCQGDIVRNVLHLHLRQPPQVLRRRSTAQGQMFAPYPIVPGAPSPPGGFKLAEGEQVSTFCQVGLGIVLSHGCEIDKDSRHRLVALIRPLASAPADAQQVIRENRNFSFFYLPAYIDKMAESYVDFRRMSTVTATFADDQERIASLTDEAVRALQLQLVTFLTRHEFVTDLGSTPQPEEP